MMHATIVQPPAAIPLIPFAVGDIINVSSGDVAVVVDSSAGQKYGSYDVVRLVSHSGKPVGEKFYTTSPECSLLPPGEQVTLDGMVVWLVHWKPINGSGEGYYLLDATAMYDRPPGDEVQLISATVLMEVNAVGQLAPPGAYIQADIGMFTRFTGNIILENK